MIALKIVEVKPFMAKLLIQNMFDEFLLSEFTMNTFSRFQINGKLNKEYFNSSELEEIGERTYAKWKEVKPFALSIVKGNKTPLSFNITLMLTKKQINQVIQTSGVTMNPDIITGLYFHIKYENSTLHIITGTGLNIFIMDKSLENAWDEQVKEFIRKNEIPFEI
jgi:hypothetical protein